MRDQLKAAGLAVAVALSATGIAGCQSTDDNVLTIGATAAPPTLDLVSNAAAAIPQVLLYNVYETLVRVNDSGKLVGLLAKSWKLSDDGLRLTFRLDPNARFASGARVTSAAVKASLERMRGASASPVNQANLAAIKAIHTPDDSTVILDLSNRDNFLLFNLASTSGVVIDPATKDLATRPQGSGPYVVTEFTPGHSVTLSPSPRPWHEGNRPTVRFAYYSDPTSQTAALLSGDLDVVSDMTTPQALSRFTGNPNYRVLRGTTNGEVVLGMNNTSKALSDRRVRQAILMAIDRKGLLDVVWNGQGTLIRVDGFLPLTPGIPTCLIPGHMIRSGHENCLLTPGMATALLSGSVQPHCPTRLQRPGWWPLSLPRLASTSSPTSWNFPPVGSMSFTPMRTTTSRSSPMSRLATLSTGRTRITTGVTTIRNLIVLSSRRALVRPIAPTRR